MIRGLKNSPSYNPSCDGMSMRSDERAKRLDVGFRLF